MTETLLEMAKDLTRSLVESGNLPAENLHDVLRQTHTTLRALRDQEEPDVAAAVSVAETPPVDWRKSITKHTVTCLECGDTFKQLSVRHLGIHGLDTPSYRVKYGIPQSQPLAARATTERRRQVVQEIRPWEKAPTYRKSQARNGQAAPEPEAEPVPEETDAPSAEAPAQPQRQRQTAPKKKTTRKKRADG
jgi:predicted transcriptional regulator